MFWKQITRKGRQMVEVTKAQFYEFVNPRDITIKSDWRKPVMTTEFSFRVGALVGKAVTDYSSDPDDTDPNHFGHGPMKYYLKEQYLNQENP